MRSLFIQTCKIRALYLARLSKHPFERPDLSAINTQRYWTDVSPLSLN